MKGLEPSTFCMASRCSSQLSYIREGRSIAATPSQSGLPRRSPGHSSAMASDPERPSADDDTVLVDPPAADDTVLVDSPAATGERSPAGEEWPVADLYYVEPDHDAPAPAAGDNDAAAVVVAGSTA